VSMKGSTNLEWKVLDGTSLPYKFRGHLLLQKYLNNA
jgi:hypothetical protein